MSKTNIDNQTTKNKNSYCEMLITENRFQKAIQFSLAAHDSIPKKRNQVQVLSREKIVLSWRLFERSDPYCIIS
jgi:hypothetical protein